MTEFLILAEARGRGDDPGALKIAWRVPEEPGPNEKAAAVAEVTGFYRRLYSEWPEHPKVIVRDETNRERKTFA